MKKNIFLFLLSLALVSCQNTTDNAQEDVATEEETEYTAEAIKAMQEEVMQAHDRVMPKMSKMSQQQRKLKQISKGQTDSVAYIEVAHELQAANENMMNWMRNFDYPEEENWSNKEIIKYLEQQRDRMLEIEEQSKQAMSQADSLLAAANAKG